MDKDSKKESNVEARAFLDFEEGEEEQQLTESSSDQEQEDGDEQDIDWAKLEDSAPSAEDYSSQSDDDTKANDSSTNIRYQYIFKLSSSSNQHCKICCNI